MSDIYCGIGKTPKGLRLGSMQECAEKRQIRLFGLKKADPRTIEIVTKKDSIPVTREKLFLKLTQLRGLVRRNKGRYEGAKEGNKNKKEYFKTWKKAEADMEKVVVKLKKVEAEREKRKNKTKNKKKK